VTVHRQRRPRKRTSAQRASIHPATAIEETLSVSVELIHVSHQVMWSQQRLGTLKMGVTGQNDILTFLGKVKQCLLQGSNSLDERVDFFTHIKPDIGRYLIVTASRGVELSGGIANSIY
jgi:hypothetical protein